MTAKRWFWDIKFSLSSINFNLCVAISKLHTSRSDTSSESKQKSVFSSFSLSITSRKSEKRRSTIWDGISRHFVLCNELDQPLHTHKDSGQKSQPNNLKSENDLTITKKYWMEQNETDSEMNHRRICLPSRIHYNVYHTNVAHIHSANI